MSQMQKEVGEAWESSQTLTKSGAEQLAKARWVTGKWGETACVALVHSTALDSDLETCLALGERDILPQATFERRTCTSFQAHEKARPAALQSPRSSCPSHEEIGELRALSPACFLSGFPRKSLWLGSSEMIIGLALSQTLSEHPLATGCAMLVCSGVNTMQCEHCPAE